MSVGATRPKANAALGIERQGFFDLPPRAVGDDRGGCAARTPTSRSGRGLLLTEPPDYADAYEIRRCEQDTRPAEEWVRCGLEQGPWVLRRIVLFAQRWLLRLKVESRSSPGHVLGWRIEASTPAVVRLAASSPLMRGIIIGRKVHPAGFVLTTLLFYRRPIPARAVWAIVAPVHRRVALYLLSQAAGAHACPSSTA